jgi:hypothetical protein
MLKKIKNKLFGTKMKYKMISIDVYMGHLQDYVVERMKYHNRNEDTMNTIAIAQEFFEFFDPEDDSEILYSHRLKEV